MLFFTDPAPLEFWSGLALSCISGGAGGTVAALNDVLKEGKGPATDQPSHGANRPHIYTAFRGVPWKTYYFSRFMIGIGGAVAILFVALNTTEYHGNLASADRLSLLALCFIAGSIGHRLLPMVAKQLEAKVERANQNAAEAKQEASSATSTAKEAIGKAATAQSQNDANLNIFKALQYLGQKQMDAPVTEKFRKELEDLRAELPLYRPLNIVLARIYRLKLNDLGSAIKVLNEFVRNKETQGQGQDEDTGAAMFNLACYYSLLAVNATQENDRDELRKLAVTSLEKATELLGPGKIDYADRDLDEIKDLPQFKAVAGLVQSN